MKKSNANYRNNINCLINYLSKTPLSGAQVHKMFGFHLAPYFKCVAKKYNIGRTGTRSHDGYIYYIRGTQAEQEATKLQESTQRLLKFLSEEPATSAEIYEQFGAMGRRYIQSPTLRVEHNIGYVGPRRCRAYFIIGSAAQTKAKEKLERLTGGKEWRSLKDVILEKLSQRPYYRSELLESICTSYLSNGYLRQKIWLDLEELIREGKILQVPADHLYSRK
ncbi:MAG: hypothetical protein QW063_02180, partial [Candidatus Nanoarchaeia archaeon]